MLAVTTAEEEEEARATALATAPAPAPAPVVVAVAVTATATATATAGTGGRAAEAAANTSSSSTGTEGESFSTGSSSAGSSSNGSQAAETKRLESVLMVTSQQHLRIGYAAQLFYLMVQQVDILGIGPEDEHCIQADMRSSKTLVWFGNMVKRQPASMPELSVQYSDNRAIVRWKCRL
jgi:hypothetical protein